MNYCSNCDSEAVWQFPGRHETVYLCQTCKDAFEWGQVNPEVDVEIIEEDAEERKEADDPVLCPKCQSGRISAQTNCSLCIDCGYTFDEESDEDEENGQYECQECGHTDHATSECPNKTEPDEEVKAEDENL